MRELFCTDPCGTNQPVALAAAPCFVCLGDLSPVPPDEPVTPQTLVFGAPPPAQVLDGPYFVTGTGISAAGATSGSDGALVLFLAPFIAGVTGSEASPTPADTMTYEIELEDGQELAIAFGAALLSGAYIKITDFYDVNMLIGAGFDTTSLTLVAADTPSGYTWQNTAHDYEITDSDGNHMNVQNVTRLSYLIDGGLLPAGSDAPGVKLFQLNATRKGTGEIIAAAIEVTTTAAVPEI